MLEQIKKTVHQIKQIKPLILNITNDVTMDFIANGLLSLGASPVMSKAKQEIADLLKLTSAIVINLGTLNKNFISLCQYTCQIANELHKPIILDPVGAGATHYRTETCLSLLNHYNIAIVRGNASEIMALSGAISLTKGVDSLIESIEGIENAKQLSQQYQTTVVMSGKTDIIIDNQSMEKIEGGSALMPSVTGTGCLLSAVVAAFHAVHNDRFEAAKMATIFYGICGENAEKTASGPGSFRTQFLDALHYC